MRLITCALALVALVPPPALAQERPWKWGWGMHPTWWMWGAGGSVMMLMMLMMLVFCGIMVTGLVLGVRWLTRETGRGRPDGALAILPGRACGLDAMAPIQAERTMSGEEVSE